MLDVLEYLHYWTEQVQDLQSENASPEDLYLPLAQLYYWTKHTQDQILLLLGE